MPGGSDERANKAKNIRAQSGPRSPNVPYLLTRTYDRITLADDRCRVDQIERAAPRQQKADMQILLRQDLEDHGDGHDRHRLRGQRAKIHAEDDIGEWEESRQTQAGGQGDAEQQFHAFAKMRSRRAGARLA